MSPVNCRPGAGRRTARTSDRFSTEILLVPGGRVQFLDKGMGANGTATPPDNGDPVQATGAAASTADLGEEIPF